MLSRPDDRSLLPGKVTDPSRTGVDKRKTLEGILWVLRPDAPWRDRPADFGKWKHGLSAVQPVGERRGCLTIAE